MNKYMLLFLCIMSFSLYSMERNETVSLQSRSEQRADAQLLIAFCKYHQDNKDPLTQENHFVIRLNQLMLELFPKPQHSKETLIETNPYDINTRPKQWFDWEEQHYKE